MRAAGSKRSQSEASTCLQARAWGRCLRARADERSEELLCDLGPGDEIQHDELCCYPGISPKALSEDLVHDAPPRLLDQLVRWGKRL